MTWATAWVASETYFYTDTKNLPVNTSAAGWAWSACGQHMLRWEVSVAGRAWSMHGKQTWAAGWVIGSVRLNWGRSSYGRPM